MDLFFAKQRQAPARAQCTLQLLSTAVAGPIIATGFYFFSSYSAQEFTSQIENKANPKINLTVLLIKGIHSFRKADINHCCGVKNIFLALSLSNIFTETAQGSQSPTAHRASLKALSRKCVLHRTSFEMPQDFLIS